jgi:integrase
MQTHKQGALVTGPRQTLGQFLERWLQDSVKPTTRPRTYETYSQKARLHIVPELGNVPLVSLTPQHLQQLYAKKLEGGLAPATVNLIHVVLHRSLKQAKRRGVIRRNVAEDVDAPARTRLDGTDKAFTLPQINRLLAAMYGHRHEALWRILLATGLRFGEAAALRWEDVDLDRRTLAVRRSLTRIPGGYAFTQPKTARGRRIIPLPAAAAETLRAHHERLELQRMWEARRWEPLDLVFPNTVGNPMREPAVLAAFHRVLEQAGLPRHRLHDLRHTYATRLFANNAHVRAVQELMGHSRSDMTLEIYTSSVPDVLRDAADRLDSLFSAQE